MRLLILPRYDQMGASSRLRMMQFLPALEAAGIDVCVAPLLGDGYVASMYAGKVSLLGVFRSYVKRLVRLLRSGSFDVLWLEKEVWPWVPLWLEALALPKRPRLIVDFDDAVFHRYDMHRSAAVRSFLGSKIDGVMRRADMVTAGNDYLAGRAQGAGCRRVEWLPTVVDLMRYPFERKVDQDCRVTVGWIGSPATAGYLQGLLPAVEAVGKRHPVRCVAIGARPDQVQGTPFESWVWSEDQETQLLQNLDIGIMPLPDEPWERGKCGYKLIQYMACGLPVVASPVGVNSDIVSEGLNGLLAESVADWEQALGRLVADRNLRLAMGAAGRQRAEAIYSVQAQAPRLISMLQDVAARSGH